MLEARLLRNYRNSNYSRQDNPSRLVIELSSALDAYWLLIEMNKKFRLLIARLPATKKVKEKKGARGT